MAAPAYAGPSAKFNPTLGLPEIVAIAALPGQTRQSQFGGPEVMFQLTDGRPWYVPSAVADEIYKARINPRQQIEVMKVGRMKHELRITPLQAHLGGPGAVVKTTPDPAAARTEQQQQYKSPNHTAPPAEHPAPPNTTMRPAAACMASAMMAAVDAIIETQAYATRKGLGLTFGEESIRAIGLSIYINECKGGSR